MLRCPETVSYISRAGFGTLVPIFLISIAIDPVHRTSVLAILGKNHGRRRLYAMPGLPRLRPPRGLTPLLVRTLRLPSKPRDPHRGTRPSSRRSRHRHRRLASRSRQPPVKPVLAPLRPRHLQGPVPTAGMAAPERVFL